ncbi:Cell division protein 48, CDC48, domain 2 [Kickxella alabastrina]|nr:Cell division protein 48, CDC48, domain 2 [Kickxella alabastrina]
MMARAAATDISANLIAMAILDMIKGEVGESGKALASAFESAKRSPGIVGKKLILQLFLEMDNISKDTSVVILAGTSAPHLMDESILRAGKLDKIMHMPRPGYASRLDILKHATRNLAVEDTDTLFTWLVELEMSRAELKGLIRAACYAAIQRVSKILDMSDFECAVASTTTDNNFISMLMY